MRFFLFGCLVFLFFVPGFVVASASTYFYVGSNALAVKDSVGVVDFVYRDRLGSDMNLKSLPFGQEIVSGSRFGFTGKEHDDSGLHYFAARYYDSSIGRFTSVDPVPSEPAYQYVRNNPLFFVDPSGRSPDAVLAKDVALRTSRYIASLRLPDANGVVLSDLDVFYATVSFLQAEQSRVQPMASGPMYIGIQARIRAVDHQDIPGLWSAWTIPYITMGHPGEFINAGVSWGMPLEGSTPKEYPLRFRLTFDAEVIPGSEFGFEIIAAQGETIPTPHNPEDPQGASALIPALNFIESQQKSLSGGGSSSFSPLVYPNPTSREFSVRLPGGSSSAHLVLYNVRGERVHNFGLVESGKSVFIPDKFTSGVYILGVVVPDVGDFRMKFTVVN